MNDLGDIYRDMHDKLLMIATKILRGDSGSAEDAIQDAFVSVMSMDRSHIRNIQSYLTKTVINFARRHHSKQKKRQKIEQL